MRFGGVVDESSANGGTGVTDGSKSMARTKRGALRKVLLVGVCVAALGLVPHGGRRHTGQRSQRHCRRQGHLAGQAQGEDPRGRTDVTFREITVEPGGSTGWHTHRGQLIAVVKSGTLTRTLDDCSVEVTPAGTSFIEPSGADHRHIGRNLGTEPVVLWVTYLLPEGSELSDDADAAHCPGGR